MSDLVGNPNCWFSHASAHIVIADPMPSASVQLASKKPNCLAKWNGLA